MIKQTHNTQSCNTFLPLENPCCNEKRKNEMNDDALDWNIIVAIGDLLLDRVL